MARKRTDDPRQHILFPRAVQTTICRRNTPKMPEGYYSGDKPNPHLKTFVEDHIKEQSYNPETDDYSVPAFDKPIETTKATAIYNMHTYWSKKPHDAIRQYIRHYTKPGDLVLDPFCGSGGTALAALMEGKKAIAIDRSPAATFITKNYCTPVDVHELQQAFEELKRKVKPEIDWLYETRCDRCDGKATTAYTVYSQVFQCPKCLKKVPLFDCIELEGKTANGKPKKINACPHCYQQGVVEEIKSQSEKFGAIPVLVSYLCENGCKPARGVRKYDDADIKKREYFEKYDLGKLDEINKKEIPYWYPKHRMMHAPEDQACWGVKWRAGTSNFRTVDELFTKRNLWALAAIREVILSFEPLISDLLLFSFSSCLLGVSKMIRESNTATMAGTYYLPQVSKEVNVFSSIINKSKVVIKGCNELNTKFFQTHLFISSESATYLNSLLSNSIDYIFTDPPYADKIQYGELNFIWESWLGFDTHWHDEEIIVNEIRGKTEIDWSNMMRQAMSECYRVLKPGRWLSLCYHDTSEGTWALIQDIMAEVGFLSESAESALFIDTKQKSYNQLMADKVNKRDLVINFRKPKPDETGSPIALIGDENEITFADKARKIIREYLNDNPGSTKDRIYDEVVSRMVRAGSMEAHNFDELLNQVAEPAETGGEAKNVEGKRWYLKETEMKISDAAESAKEDAAAEKMKTYIAQHLKKNPNQTGVHYSDLFECYVTQADDKPRRPLADWLLDYFYKTETGTYRLAISEEEKKLKAEGRERGTHRLIKRYLAYLEHDVTLPDNIRPNDATLAEWIRHCKRCGLYEQGKLLYERGGLNLDNLSEEIMVNVEEDYQTCNRMLARHGEKKSRKMKG